MNLVERIFRLRDYMVERGELNFVLPEEEHKKHVKDKTLPSQNIVMPRYNESTQFVRGGSLPNGEGTAPNPRGKDGSNKK